ncbi:uncharacterized protein LOC135688364 [Rhopilema esculentum]|uniref:uncharacterized protein LOC135688364 n=1 Tax=Rhopilema esculentum TaxID=499914 RepID=UPI0031D831C9|eukprot:gene7047-12676_t
MADRVRQYICLFVVLSSLAIAFARPRKDVAAKKREFAKDFSMVGEQKKECTYNDQKISHGTIAYQDVCGKFTCTDGYMAWYYFPNAAHFDVCHVPVALERHNGEGDGMVMSTIPVYSTKSTGDKMERISVIGGPTHGEVEHYSQDEDNHHDPHHATIQTTTIDVKAAHEPHGKPTIEVHNPTTHSGAISVTDHGGHHGEVVTQTK